MNNINTILAENIQKYRKEKEMTQEELADKLGVTYQAISKWENAKSAPDISFLPILADLFGCSIDTLFSRDHKAENPVQWNLTCTTLPWSDDDVLRGVVYLGQRILQVKDGITDKFTFEVVGDAKRVESECSISILGSVDGGCNAKGSISVGGYANGGINCGNGVSVGGYHCGGINCGDNVSCGGNIEGSINCGSNVTCHNLDARSINCGDGISASGEIHSDVIKTKGDVYCQKLNCQKLICKAVKVDAD